MVERHRLAGCSVVELGSRNVNGTVRDLFTGTYLGIDREAGPGVDVVADVEDPHTALRFGQADVVISTEALEHTPHPERFLRTAAHLCRPGGTLLLTCRGYDERGCWEVHDAPDYWRFGRPAMVELLLPHFYGATVETDPDGPGWLVHARRH